MLPSFLTHVLANGWTNTAPRITIAAVVTLTFALLARALRGVNASGAVAGAVTCLLLFAGVGPAAFGALATLFVLTSISTRLGYRRKLARGVAERKEGRNAWQVLANLAAPALCSVMFGATGHRAWIVAMTAALAEAATDTVASEVGQAGSSRPRMITTWAVVSPGTDGGITTGGTLAGILGGVLTASVSIITLPTSVGFATLREICIPVTCGILGMFFDSLLGATLQRRGWISNQGVNSAATILSAALGYFLAGSMR
jgi:uncharacterized protein (TIGR00297 family)